MFEGVPNYPDNSRFWNVVDSTRSTSTTAPTAIRADAGRRRAGEEDLAAIVAAARLSRRTHQSGSLGMVPPRGRRRRCPIVDTWWQTETGGI
jgi:acetyl-CoA synthetase